MRLRRILTALLVFALAPATFDAALANAAEPAPKGIAGAFEIHGTHGFRLFGLIASDGKSGALILGVGRKGESATYFARGAVTKEGAADFDLGALGHIDITAEPTGRTETVHPACGNAATVEGERYVGSIEFHGEEGFTDAEATSTPLRWRPILDIVCPGFSRSEASGEGLRGARLQIRREGGPKVEIEQNHPGARVFYEAHVAERNGAVRVDRTVTGHLRPGALSYEPSLASATFGPHGPFSGTATYASTMPPRRAKPGEGTWRGDLTVDFPGRGGVALTGESFSASIVHARRTESRF